MSDNLHIIITGNEGKVRNLLLSRRKLKVSSLLCLSLFVFCSGAGLHHYLHSTSSLSKQVVGLNSKLTESNRLKEELASQVNTLQQEKDSLAQRYDSQKNQFRKEKSILLNSAVSELEERSNLMERIMGNVGVDIDSIPKKSKNSGGPFVSPEKSSGKELLHRSDIYLDSFCYLPLGRPVPGPVTSGFGHRTDPVNGKKGLHTGVDMRGRTGQKIIATGDGVVKKAFKNGSYGRYVEIDHGNGYSTKFAHMKKILVKRGERVKRGQPIGTVGSSGRSTGPHLHYEVCLNKKPVNPSTFMRVDKLASTPLVPHIRIQPLKKRKHAASLIGKSPVT